MKTLTHIQQVFEQLQQEGVLQPGWENKLDDAAEHVIDAQPWYVRTMIGFGSWLASLLIIVAILAGMNVYERDVAAIALGLVFIVGATALRRTSSHDFTVQMALAFCLAGQGILLFGVGDMVHRSFESFLYGVVLLQVIMILIYPDRVLRFLSVLFAVQAVVLLLFKWDVQALLHGLVFVLLLAYLWLEKNSFRSISRGGYEIMVPVKYGLLVAALAVLMLSTIYILPELNARMSFFPYPWVSSILSGLLFMAVIADILQRQNASAKMNMAGVVVVIFVLASLQMPGLIVACLLILLGYDRSLNLVLMLGFAFMTAFLAAWFYGLEVSLLAKSGSLVAAGTVLLLIRFGVRHWLADSSEAHHA